MTKTLPVTTLLVMSMMLSASYAVAQSSTSSIGDSRTSAGGYTGNALRGIYNQDVGTGYTSQSLNAISLQNARAHVGYVGQSAAGMPQLSTGAGSSFSSSSSSKPFSSVSSSPTVSPYMNLFREDLNGNSDLNYQTLVQPQLKQQQYNQQFQRQNMELSSRVQQISAQSDYKNPAGSETMYPTGHQTAFGAYSHFYPSLGQQRRKR